ncbi:MAG: UDP-N-acetylmuramate dehydrogenase [Acidobacteriota bacterium]
MTSTAASPTSIRLADRTTLGVGGPAARWASVPDAEALRDLLQETRDGQLLVLGGGSNLLVADAGFDGLVLSIDDRRTEFTPLDNGSVGVSAGAGVDWDELVATTVAEGLAGLECLSGIPGRVGAAPIQNIGAYGQELATTVETVQIVDRATGATRVLSAAACGFGYRTSAFKRARRGGDLGRQRGDLGPPPIVTRVDLRLAPRPTGRARYGDLLRHLRLDGEAEVPLAELRAAVLAVRRSKAMVLDPSGTGPDARSAGSFFLNPIVAAADADRVADVARRRGTERTLPRYPADGPPAERRVKLPAAWLIEEAGFARGHRRGRAAISSRHTLALVTHEGARAAEVVDLAREIRQRVRRVFGISLEPEPTFVGFETPTDQLLDAEPGTSVR